MKDSVGKAIASLRHARAQQTFYENKRRREYILLPGDEVLLNTANQKLAAQRPAPKLNPKWCGPLKVLHMVGKNAVKLELTPGLRRLHLVFNISSFFFF